MLSFLRRFRNGRTTEPASLPVDPTLGDPEAIRLQDAMRKEDWPTARGVLARTTDPDELSFLVYLAADQPGSEVWLPDVIRDEPGSTLPTLMYGCRAIRWAWEARTHDRAQYVSNDRFKLFFQRIGIAEDCLEWVIQREPGNVTAHALRVLTARAAEVGIPAAWERFNRVVALHPWHQSAHNQMLQQLCAKWGGSHGDMHAFAERAVANAPPGSPLGVLVARAHLEQWMDNPGGGYWNDPAVVKSLRWAADRSIRHPEYRRERFWPGPHNEFALAFALAGLNALAAEQFRIIGDQVTESPWSYFEDPGVQFCEIRAIVRRAVSR